MPIYFSLLVAFLLAALCVRALVGERYSWGEIGLTMLGLALVLGIGYGLAVHAETSDRQVLSGKVTGKKRVRVSCSHSYSCRCRSVCSGSGRNRSCHRVCDTCYEHAYDVDWDVYSSIGTFTINRIDRRGMREPPRWTAVKAGEPVSRVQHYTNWLKAVPDSGFRRVSPETLPAYPLHIYDYYRIDRVVAHGVKVPAAELRRLSSHVSERLKDVAGEKQVNLVVVLTARERAFSEDLRAGWINGKKNDLVVVVGARSYPAIDWVEVFGWSVNDLAHVKTRDDIRDHGRVDERLIDIAIDNIVRYWRRKPMEEFSYLSREIRPGAASIVLLVAFGVLTLAGASYYFSNNGDSVVPRNLDPVC